MRIHIDNCSYIIDEVFNPDCPACMETWDEFLEKKNLYVITDKRDEQNRY